jgi:hypothetical protein
MHITPQRKNKTFLHIVPVEIRAHSGKVYETFAPLDRACEISLLCDEVRQFLGLDGPKMVEI